MRERYEVWYPAVPSIPTEFWVCAVRPPILADYRHRHRMVAGPSSDRALVRELVGKLSDRSITEFQAAERLTNA